MCWKRRLMLAGLLILLAISELQAQEKGTTGQGTARIKVANPQMAVVLLHTEIVRQQIGFTDAQLKELEPFEEALYKTNSPSTTLAACARLEETMRRVLRSDQSARLDQILLQALGPNIFESPDVADAIGLSREQTERINRIVEAGTKAEWEIARTAGLNVPQVVTEASRVRSREISKQMHAIKKASFGKIIDILTPDQRDRLASITGEEIDVGRLNDQMRAVEPLRHGKPISGSTYSPSPPPTHPQSTSP